MHNDKLVYNVHISVVFGIIFKKEKEALTKWLVPSQFLLVPGLGQAKCSTLNDKHFPLEILVRPSRPL